MRQLYLLIALLFCGGLAQAADSTAVRLWGSAENIRLVLENDSRLPYSVSDISNPPRLFIDIETGGDHARIIERINHLPLAAQPYVSGVRAATHKDGTLRIVFDLTAQIHYRVQRIRPIENYRHRLVIDIAPQQQPADPLLALLEQLEEKQPDGAKPFLVVIDPGHGGEDPGAVSPNNRYEKNIVLKISRLLADSINNQPNMRAILTRAQDKFIPLYERVHIAHRLNADIFLSIHADSVKSRKARGSSVFILSKKGASTKFARRLAQQENLSDLIGGQPTTRNTVLDAALRQFSQDGKERASRQLASLILTNLGKINKLHSKRVESAGFAVLKSPSIPSVLVETAFISNQIEENKLISAAFQHQLSDAITEAVTTYYRRHHTTE